MDKVEQMYCDRCWKVVGGLKEAEGSILCPGCREDTRDALEILVRVREHEVREILAEMESERNARLEAEEE